MSCLTSKALVLNHSRPHCRATGLHSGPFFILGGARTCTPAPKPSSGGMGTSLVTMTEEGLSQPVEGVGRGSHRQHQVGALYWAFLVHPPPLVSRLNYPECLRTDG